MSNRAHLSSAEDLYFAIYQSLAAKSDYMQPDGYNQMLPEAVTIASVISVLTAIFTGITKGFFSKLGGDLADLAKKLLKRLHSEIHDPENLVGILSESVPLLESNSINWDEIMALIALELTRKRLSFSLSQELAKEIVESIQSKISKQND